MNGVNFGWVKKVSIGAFKIDDQVEIRFHSKFDNNAQPNESRIEILNLSKTTVRRFKRGMRVTLEAGYDGDFGILSIGKLDKITERWEGPTKINTLYYIEGDDFSKIKVDATTATKDTVRYHKDGHKQGDVVEGALAINFAKGTDGLTIIKRLSSALGMKIEGDIILRENVVYKKGYSCTKVILNDLETVVNDCGSIIYHRRGKIVIRPINMGTDERFKLTEETGLIGIPSMEESQEGTIIKVRCALQHRITTCSIIDIESRYIKGKYRVFKGEHIAEKSQFYTEFYAI